jgi:hypothetical protein
MPIVLKCGSLNLLEPSGPDQACNVIAFFLKALIINVTPAGKNVLWIGEESKQRKQNTSNILKTKGIYIKLYKTRG